MGSTTTIKEFVKNSWKLLVDDCLARFINWEGRDDARLDAPKKSAETLWISKAIKS